MRPRPMILRGAMASALLIAVFAAGTAYALDGAGPASSTDPFEGPIRAFYQLVTGNVAMGIAMAGVVACGIALIFGGEIKDFIKTLITIALVLCLVILAAKVVAFFTGADATALVFPAAALPPP